MGFDMGYWMVFDFGYVVKGCDLIDQLCFKIFGMFVGNVVVVKVVKIGEGWMCIYGYVVVVCYCDGVVYD